jgi:hypothetical protein
MTDTTTQIYEIADRIAKFYPAILRLIDSDGLPHAIECYIRDAVADGTEESWIITALLNDGGDVSTQLTFELLGEIARNY